MQNLDLITAYIILAFMKSTTIVLIRKTIALINK